MSPIVVIINGPPGVGKSSVTAALQALLDGVVCISGDALRQFAPIKARAMLGPGSTYRAAAELVRFYLKAGAPVVIFEYVFETPAQINCFEAALDSTIPRKFITLWASLASLEARDAMREGSARQGNRVAQCVSTMSPHLQSLGLVIDTEQMTANEVAARIHRLLQAAAS